MGRLSFSLDAVPPFRLDLTAWAIRRRPENAVDLWDGETYQRVLAVRGKAVLTSVRQLRSPDAPRIDVTVRAAYLPSTVKGAVSPALERLLGAWDAVLKTDLDISEPEMSHSAGIMRR